jgi:hypothetical protein
VNVGVTVAPRGILRRTTHQVMKRVLALAAVVSVGVAAGVLAWRGPATVTSGIHTALAALLAANFLLCLWAWHRARPGSGDAIVMPTVMLGSAANLALILPRVLLPADARAQIAGTIVGAIAVIIASVLYLRQRRSNRGSGGSV